MPGVSPGTGSLTHRSQTRNTACPLIHSRPTRGSLKTCEQKVSSNMERARTLKPCTPVGSTMTLNCLKDRDMGTCPGSLRRPGRTVRGIINNLPRYTGLVYVLLTLCALYGLTHADNDNSSSSTTNSTQAADDTLSWMECHGFNKTACRVMKDKVRELEIILAHRSRQNAQQTYAQKESADKTSPHKGPHLDTGWQEQLFLTPEQIQYFIDTLSHRRRFKRKVDSFSQFVSKWALPIKYAFDGSHTDEDREKIREAISHWEAQTCVRFQEVDPNSVNPSDGNRILFMKYRGCGSYIGKVNISPQPVDLASRCLRHFGIIAHEIGHVIGFWHEHQRSDRDAYIQIKSNNAVVGLSFVSELMRLGRTSNLLPYDYGSVLHYSAKTMSVNGDYTIETKDPLYQKTIGQRTGLSFLDAKLANLVYCTASCPTPLAKLCRNEGYQDPNNCNVCRCPDGLSGTYCDRVAPSVNAACGGHILVYDTPQFVTSPNYYQGYYDDHVQCTWLLQAEVGYTIQLRFDSDFNVYCVDGVCFHWVEIRYADSVSNVGPRFCCSDVPQVTLQSTKNQMMILFRSNYTTYNAHRRGFRAMFWAVPNNKQPSQTFTSKSWFTNGPDLAQAVTRNTAQTTHSATGTQQATGVTRRTGQTTHGPTHVPLATWPTQRPGQGCSPLDVVLILDSSGSVGASNWLKVLEFAVDIAQRLPIGYTEVRLAAISFGSTASLHAGLLSYTSGHDVSAMLRGIRWKDEMTNTSGGIWLARNDVFTPSGGDRPWAPNVAILLIDGEANRDVDRTIPEATLMKQAGITLKIIGVGARLNRPELETMGSQPLNENLYFASTFDDLIRLESRLMSSICKLTVEASSPPHPSVQPSSTRGPGNVGTSGPNFRSTATPATTHRSTSTLGPATFRSTVTLGATPGPTIRSSLTQRPTTGQTPGPACNNPGMADIAFIVDSSGSIGPVNWRKVLQFLQTFVSQLTISSSQHRVGVVTYGTYGEFQFGLDKFTNTFDLQDAIGRLRWLDEMTNTSGGIWVTRSLLFDYRSGDRPYVPNIAIVLTDGESNRDPDRVRPEADAARQAGISMFVIGVGDKLNMVELESIANSPTDDYLYRTRGFNDLQYVIVNIIRVICSITRTVPTQGTAQMTSRRPQTQTAFTSQVTRQTSQQTTQRTTQRTTQHTTTRPTNYPTWTPQPTNYPTWTPQPTNYPTWTPQPTNYPTWTPQPTKTSGPTTRTQPPTRTPFPIWTPYPTYRPGFTRGPTRTTSPTATTTQRPTWTPYPTPSSTIRPGPTYITPVDCTSARADIVFILDSSGSVGQGNWPIMMNFTKAVMRLLPYGQNQFSVVTFGNQADVNIRLGEYPTQGSMFAAIDTIRWKDEWTNTSGGLRVMKEEVLGPLSRGVRRIGILVTDGESNKDKQKTIPEARLIHTQGITMFAIGVGNNLDLRELQVIASDPQSTYLLRIDSFPSLWTAAAGVTNIICRISGGGRPASPQPPVTGTPAPSNGLFPACYPLDIAFVLDASHNIPGVNDWGLLLRFVSEVISALPLSSTKVKIGVITYSDKAEISIPLGAYTGSRLYDAVNTLSWRNQRTNTSGGILLMRSKVLIDADSTRYNVPKVGIIITSGQSDMDAHLTLPEADVAKQQGIHLYTIGVTSKVNTGEVTGMASTPTSSHSFFTASFSALYTLKQQLLNAVCARYDPGRNVISPPQYPTNYPPPNPTQPHPTPAPTPAPKPTPTPAVPTPAPANWGPWTDCSRPCGGCGKRWRSKQCADSRGRTQDCGIPEEESCNQRPCTTRDVCKFYVAWRQYNRPCQPCCYSYIADYSQNLCVLQ